MSVLGYKGIPGVIFRQVREILEEAMDWEVLGEVKEHARPIIYSISVFAARSNLKIICTLFTFKKY